MNTLSTTLHPLDALRSLGLRLRAALWGSARHCLALASGREVCLGHDEFRSLSELSPSTLKDIGAPDWMAERRAELRSRELDQLRL